MKKDFVMIIGIGIPVAILMIVIGGGGHSPSPDFEDEKTIIEKPKQVEPSLSESTSQTISQDCSGTGRCIIGKVTQVIDGDTIKVDRQSIRFALSSAPEINEFGGDIARDFISEICPVGSTVLVDEDDGQTGGSHGRIVGMVYCNGMNLNEELVDSGFGYLALEFCDRSEFSSHTWTLKHGCMTNSVSEPNISIQVPQVTTNNCDSSYPDVCIPTYPPDLDCGEISFSNFRVLQPDPHGFDRDNDGIGCEK